MTASLDLTAQQRATEDSPKAGPVEGKASGGPQPAHAWMCGRSITDRIIAMLEKGGNVFRERWTRAASRGMPRNGKTGAPYHGANVLLLWDAAIEQGYASNVWLTYKQAASLGAQVRKGERGVMCAHFERTSAQGMKLQLTRRTSRTARRRAGRKRAGRGRQQGRAAAFCCACRSGFSTSRRSMACRARSSTCASIR